MASNVIKVICGESPDPPIFTLYTPIGGLKPRRGGLNDGGDLMSLTHPYTVFGKPLFQVCYNRVTSVLQVCFQCVRSVCLAVC